MKTISQVVDELISESPFLEEALSEELINISSLARRLQPAIEARLYKEVKPGAIVMAIKRRPTTSYIRISRKINEFMENLGDIIVRSELSDYTFENSLSLNHCNSSLIDEISDEKDVLCAISQGIFETTLVVSSVISKKIERIFIDEKMLSKKDNLSSVSLRLPASNTEISGIYYFFLKNLAWAGINVCEVISTSNEITFVVDYKDVDKAFSVLMSLKKKPAL